MRATSAKSDRLRTASELFPEIIDAESGEDPLPSCSAVEALDRQEPFINQTLAASALAMLAQLLRYGGLDLSWRLLQCEVRKDERIACRSRSMVEDAAAIKEGRSTGS